MAVGIVLWWLPGTAAAETEGQVNELVWAITSQLLTIVDGVLGHFVEGNTLSGAGEDLVSSLANIFQNAGSLLAQFSSWLYRAPG